MNDVVIPPADGHTALIVVDMQNGFLKPDGSCARVGLPNERLAAALRPCVRAVAAARRGGVPVIFTRYTFRSDFADGGFLVKEKFPALETARALVAGTEDHALVAELAPREADYVIDKNRPSSFIGTPLESYLHGKGVTSVVICGVTTNCCVESTARDASQRDYRTFVLRDAVAEYDEDRHLNALKGMDMLFAHLLTTADLEKAWSRGVAR